MTVEDVVSLITCSFYELPIPVLGIRFSLCQASCLTVICVWTASEKLTAQKWFIDLVRVIGLENVGHLEDFHCYLRDG